MASEDVRQTLAYLSSAFALAHSGADILRVAR